MCVIPAGLVAFARMDERDETSVFSDSELRMVRVCC